MASESAKKPSWENAPELANWLAQDEDGRWFWYKAKPFAASMAWIPLVASEMELEFAARGDVAGDWRETIEPRPNPQYDPETVAFKRDLNPASSSITDSQAKQAAAETGICSDGEQCGDSNGYCEGCPNDPWGGEARIDVIGQNGNGAEHYMIEPEWIKWTGETDVCPVPHGNDVEVEFLDGSKERDSTPEEWGWYNNPKHVTDGDIVAYRDWTAFNLTNQKAPTDQRPESRDKGHTTSVSTTLSEREQTYGDFATLAAVVEGVQEIYSSLPGWDRASPAHREAAHMIIQKLARAFNGSPHYSDSWHDIAGYAQLAEKECLK